MANSYNVLASSIDCPGAMTKSWNSLLNSGKASPSASRASSKLIGKTLKASSPRKPRTKLDNGNTPSPTFLILKPMPS